MFPESVQFKTGTHFGTPFRYFDVEKGCQTLQTLITVTVPIKTTQSELDLYNAIFPESREICFYEKGFFANSAKMQTAELGK